MSEAKSVLQRYLQTGRDSLLWKLEGLSEYDLRRPMVATGTNLLGIVKHVASVEAGYLGDCLARPFEQEFPWFTDDAEPNADMWATADESSQSIIDLYRRVWSHSDATIATLELDAVGEVPWWPDGQRTTTLQHLLVHMIAETHRHAGQADIVRELIDGSVGWLPGRENLPAMDEAAWVEYRERLEQVAREARGL